MEARLSEYRTHIGWTLLALIAVTAAALWWYTPVAHRFGVMGVEHILTGYDHLAFLVMLMIATRNFPDLIWVATAFTVAHSLALTAASLGWVATSASWVEPLIALTILYVAVENLLTAQPKARPALTFGFGLIHGLGFASALADGPLPRNEELLALLSFNIGVEAGQIAFLAVCYPVWRYLARRYADRTRQMLALTVVALCLYWLWERLA